MTTKSDRNLSHVEAVQAGLVSDYETPVSKLPADLPFPMICKRESDWNQKVQGPQVVMTPSLEKQLADLAKNSPTFTNSTAKDIKTLMTTEAVKADTGKLDWSLVPFEALEEIAKVMEYGKNKYSAHNWSSNGGFKYTRVFNALMRHLLAFMRGEDNDPETGLSHLAHCGCNILFLLHFVKFKDKYNTCDDRQVKN